MNLDGVCAICKEFAVITGIWNGRGICQACVRNIGEQGKVDEAEPIDETGSDPS